MVLLVDKSKQAPRNKQQFLKWRQLNPKQILHSECRYLNEKLCFNKLRLHFKNKKNSPIINVATTIIKVKILNRKSESDPVIPPGALESIWWRGSLNRETQTLFNENLQKNWMKIQQQNLPFRRLMNGNLSYKAEHTTGSSKLWRVETQLSSSQ